jgi:hypothetical protein
MLLMLSHIIHIFTFYAQRYTYMCDTACLYTKGLYPECIRSSYNLIEKDKQPNFLKIGKGLEQALHKKRIPKQQISI